VTPARWPSAPAPARVRGNPVAGGRAIQIRTILVPTDFSSHAERALDYAIELAEVFSSRIHLLHAYHLPVQIGLPDQVMVPTEFWDQARDAAAARIQESLARLTAAGIPCDAELLPEAAAPAIVESARHCAADLIVMGTRGRTGMTHVLLGSVAERVVRLAPCPVLTLREEV
jgi:universal stress protein A